MHARYERSINIRQATRESVVGIDSEEVLTRLEAVAPVDLQTSNVGKPSSLLRHLINERLING
jgi:hypothetical protein